MDDEIAISVSIPLDDDGFLRRECPNCEREFKWFAHAEGSQDAEQVDQYFCPLCGEAAAVDQWMTPAQNEYALGVAAPDIDDMIDNALKDVFGSLNSKHFKVKKTGRFTRDVQAPEPLHEENDMVVVESPCHPNEPVKVPEGDLSRIHCLICGTPFAT